MQPMTQFLTHSRLLPLGEDTGDDSTRSLLGVATEQQRRYMRGLRQC